MGGALGPKSSDVSTTWGEDVNTENRSTPTISRTFARWAAGLVFEDLPAEVVEKVKALVLFHLVACRFGSQDPHARELVELVKAEEARADGATILVDGAKVTRSGAVLANWELAHVAGLWDSFRMITHRGPVLIAVGLANAELGGKSGKDLITALDEDGLVATIAIAASSASGLNEPGRVGGDERVFQEPNPARQGVYPALMASLGHARASESPRPAGRRDLPAITRKPHTSPRRSRLDRFPHRGDGRLRGNIHLPGRYCRSRQH